MQLDTDSDEEVFEHTVMHLIIKADGKMAFKQLRAQIDTTPN